MKIDHVTDASLELLIRAFYGKLRLDPQLAPIFTAALGSDWSAHMATMDDFWGSAMRVSRRYEGDMLAAHRRLEGLRPALFGRWLDLFERTVDENFTAEAGAALRDRARKTARNLQLALFSGAAPVSGAAPAGGSGDGHARAPSAGGGASNRSIR